MELKTGRKVLEIQGNVDILRLGKFFSKIYKSRNLSEEDLLKEYMKYLTQINKDFTMENIVEYHVYDEKYAQPIIECNYSDFIMEDKLKDENIYLCTMPQIYPEDRGMNYAIKLGNKIAKEVLEQVNKKEKD